MIYNTKNESNDITESHKEKETCFNVHFQYSQLKIMGLYKIGPLTSPHAVQYKWQQGSVLKFCSYYFKNE